MLKLQGPCSSLFLLLFVCSSLQARAEPQRTVTKPAPSAEATGALVGEIRRAEYRFNPVKGEAGVWAAPNRGQELRSRVSEQGIEVFPRSTSANGVGAPWKLTLTTTSFGRVDGAFPLPPASVRAKDERVELDHGYLVEWFVNEERGIEQGWTIAVRPIGSETLTIGLAIEGDLRLRIEEGGRAGVFVDACGEAVLRYRDLLVFDATGRELEARLVPTPAGVAIEVEDAGAAYPVTVDPSIVDAAWSADSDQVDAGLGVSVSSAGDVNGDGFSDVIVGASMYDGGQTDEGRTWVHHGAASGLAALPAWSAESDQPGAQFGASVSAAGDVNDDGYADVIVGAYQYDGGEVDEGRAYVYHGSASGLGASPAWTIESNQAGAFLGESVSTAGDVNGDGYADVVVGVRHYGASNPPYGWGSAWVFHGSATGLAASAAWTVESDQGNAFFGESVSTAGDVNGDGYSDVIVGAPWYEYFFPEGGSATGAAFVYHGSASGLAAQPAWTGASYDFNPDAFGSSVSTAGDVNGDGYSDVVVGAYGFAGYHGGAFVYLGSPAGLVADTYPSYESNQSFAYLGWSVSTAGDVNGDGYSDLALGVPGFDNGENDEGRVLVYLGSASGPPAIPTWQVEANHADAFFGSSIATAGDVNGDGYADLLVGAPGYDDGEGRAFVYHGAARGLTGLPVWEAGVPQVNSDYAVSVSTAGDVDGDGYSDVIIGAPGYDNGELDEGRAFVYLGSPSGPHLGIADWVVEANEPGMGLGASVSTAGDVNGDGYSDVLVSAFTFDLRGRVYAYHGSAAGLATSPAWSAESNQAEAFFGRSVSTAGDVNGDGYSDAIVGAPFYDGAQQGEGRAYVYHGSASGLTASPAWSATFGEDDAHLGSSVSTAGDVNGDGYSDVIVGADGSQIGQQGVGRAYVYHGRAAGLATSPAWIGEAGAVPSSLGSSVATAGDVNGDGYSDVIVGEQTLADGEVQEGGARVYHGSASGLAATAAWTVQSNHASAEFGGAVSSAGDVNGDGYSDVVVGAAWYGDNEGRAFAYLGSASGLAASPAWAAEPEPGYTGFGETLSTAGDVNGDGYSDVIVGAPGNEKDSVGRAFLFLGNEGAGGRVRAFQQLTSDGSQPLALLALVRESFRIRCEFESDLAGFARGTTTAHLEWEVKPIHVPFDETNVQRGADQAIGGTLVFDELAFLDDSVRHAHATKAQSYRWRARVATTAPGLPHTPWFSAPGNNITEAKLRKPGLRFP